MKLEPVIFVSSVISEFVDLRSALRYFFKKAGYVTLTSEKKDFGVDSVSDSIDACKKQIDQSDFIILLIGEKAGYNFALPSNEITSVTKEEYRYINEILTNGSEKKLIIFVKDIVWKEYSDKPESNFQTQFIHEMINGNVTEGKIGRWVYSFKDFEDVVSVLNSNIHGLYPEITRKQQTYKAFVQRELMSLFKLFIGGKGIDEPMLSIFDVCPKLDIDFGYDLLTSKVISRKMHAQISAFQIGFPTRRFEGILDRLSQYVINGEFVVYNNSKSEFELQNFAKVIIQMIELIRKVYQILDNPAANFEIFRKQSNEPYTIPFDIYTTYRTCRFDSEIAFSKLIMLINMFESKTNDLIKADESYYNYTGGSSDSVKPEYIEQYIKDIDTENSGFKSFSFQCI